MLTFLHLAVPMPSSNVYIQPRYHFAVANTYTNMRFDEASAHVETTMDMQLLVKIFFNVKVKRLYPLKN